MNLGLVAKIVYEFVRIELLAAEIASPSWRCVRNVKAVACNRAKQFALPKIANRRVGGFLQPLSKIHIKDFFVRVIKVDCPSVSLGCIPWRHTHRVVVEVIPSLLPSRVFVGIRQRVLLSVLHDTEIHGPSAIIIHAFGTFRCFLGTLVSRALSLGSLDGNRSAARSCGVGTIVPRSLIMTIYCC